MAERERLKDFPLEALAARMAAVGEPAYRARQLASWMYCKRVDGFAQMSNISKVLRAKLEEYCERSRT